MTEPTHNIIVMWSGAIADIPEGWKLCDGYNDTPDLSEKFIIGAGSTYNPGDTGGSEEHTHDFTSNSHEHIFNPGTGLRTAVSKFVESNNAMADGTTDPKNHLPLYHALCYIMKK